MKGGGNDYDYGERIYDPRLGRWSTVDKFAHAYSALSPYNYTANNPVNLIDRDGNLIRDGKGNIVFVPIMSSQVTHPSGSSANVTFGYIFANDGTKIMVFKNTDANQKGWDTDCHGSSFTGGKYWINNDQVPTILNSDGYKEKEYSKRQASDKIVFTDKDNNVEDSRTLTTDKNKVKGQGGLEEKDYVSDIDNTWTSANGPTKKRVFTRTEKDVVYNDAQIANLTNEVKSGSAAEIQETMAVIAARVSNLPTLKASDEGPQPQPKSSTGTSTTNLKNPPPLKFAATPVVANKVRVANLNPIPIIDKTKK